MTRYLNGRDPIGMRFRWGYPNINPQTESEIIGVIEIGATLVVALLASVATMIPALRASKTSPSEVLRS